MAKKAGPRISGGKELPKKQYCPEHGVEAKGIMVMPGRRMKYVCPEGCKLSKREVVLK